MCLRPSRQVAADIAEYEVLLALSQHLVPLINGQKATDACIQELADMLPALEDMAMSSLSRLVQLHLGSSSRLMTLLKLLVPAQDAFRNSTAVPDLQVLCNMDDRLMVMVDNLIELQLFHLTRAQAITAEMRHRLVCCGRQQTPHGITGTTDGSNCGAL